MVLVIKLHLTISQKMFALAILLCVIVTASGWLSRPIAKALVPIAVGGSIYLGNTPLLSNVAIAADSISLSDKNGISESTNDRKVVKLPSGLEYFDVKIGDGEGVVNEGNSVQFQWVLRRSNGYYVDSSGTEPGSEFIYKVGNTKKVIRGIDEGIRGMKVGGVRRLAVPPQLAWVEGLDSSNPGPIPSDFGPRRQIMTRLDKETWYFEIKVVKIK